MSYRISQILTNIGPNCNVKFPSLVERTTSALSVVNVNILPNLGNHHNGKYQLVYARPEVHSVPAPN